MRAELQLNLIYFFANVGFDINTLIMQRVLS